MTERIERRHVLRTGENEWFSSQGGQTKVVRRVEHATRFTPEVARALSEKLTINRRKPVVEVTDTAYINPLAHEPWESPREPAPPEGIPPCVLLQAYEIEAIRRRAVAEFGPVWLHHYPRLLEAAMLDRLVWQTESLARSGTGPVQAASHSSSTAPT